MRNLFLTFCLGSWLAFAPAAEAARAPQLSYHVDLNDRADDHFKVTLDVKGLRPENNVFQFAATAPGTYQIMDMGRYVRDFKAFDRQGRELATSQTSTNQWQLSEPTKVRKITYRIAETWDTPVAEKKIYGMCGTSLEQDHALINGQGVFGYVQGLQGVPFDIRLAYPQEWLVGTALKADKKGRYRAANYDHAVDSPILLGTLTKAQTNYNGTTIDLYTYSKTGLIQSEDLLRHMSDMLGAAHKFVVDFPVDRYTFLFHFEDVSWGAWEHSYSSEYILKEEELTPEYAEQIVDIAGHEFFHVVTPLNIHSEVISQFNFVTPTPSQHLWLYEGTTEWASDIMRLRAGLLDLPGYLKDLQQKLQHNDKMDPSYSLQQLSLTSYTPEGQAQYFNIYNRGAVTAALLDIRLLELSGGQRGLREVINGLSKEFGPQKAFPENGFFELFTARTHPEIADFFDRYVKGTEPLPLADYFGKVGLRYAPTVSTGQKKPFLGYGLAAPDLNLRLVRVKEDVIRAGLEENDLLSALNGVPITMQNAQEEFSKLLAQPVGQAYTLTVTRAGQPLDLKLNVLEKEEVSLHNFGLNEQASPQQLALRASWLRNL